MSRFVKIPETNIGSLKNVEETESFTKTVTEKQEKV